MDTTVLFLCFVSAIVLTLTALSTSIIRIVREDRRLSVYRLGRYSGEKGPGVVLLIPTMDRAVLKEVGGAAKTPSRRLAGAIGETRTTVYTDGKVFLAGEEWEAMNERPISAGQRVRVARMILAVEEER